MGHSLGGGIAALMAHTLHDTPALLERLGQPYVSATTFGCPPVMTYELALKCAPYVRSLVLGHGGNRGDGCAWGDGVHGQIVCLEKCCAWGCLPVVHSANVPYPLHLRIKQVVRIRKGIRKVTGKGEGRSKRIHFRATYPS